MSPIALDAQAATRTLVIARPRIGPRATVQLPEPEISGLLQVYVMAAGRGPRAAADTVLQHSGAVAAPEAVEVFTVVEDSGAVAVVASAVVAAVAVAGVARTSS
jgi:hypothetical protein